MQIVQAEQKVGLLAPRIEAIKTWEATSFHITRSWSAFVLQPLLSETVCSVTLTHLPKACFVFGKSGEES